MKKRTGFIIKLAMFAIIAFLLVSIISNNVKINNLKKEIEEYQKEREECQLKVEKLSSELSKELDEETIKKLAQEKLNLRDPLEVNYASDLPY